MTDATLPLYSPVRVQQLLAKHGLRPTKAFGQNFLIDGNILRLIADAGGAAEGEHILEVGPGLGVLTHEMARRGADVTALEKDEKLRPVLAETLGHLPNVEVIWGDALQFDMSTLHEKTRVVANLPYYITGPLLVQFARAKRVVSATVLVQKEVAQRLVSAPGADNYGFLTALVALHGSAHIVHDVPKGAFIPAPNVTSSVVRIDFDRERPMPSAALVRFIDAALAHRRKTLRNNLKMAGFALPAADEALEAAGLAPTVRAEDVPLEQMLRLAAGLGVQ